MEPNTKKTEGTCGINTPYDDVFRTLLNDCPDLIIPVINNTFGTNFVMGRDKVTQNNNEFFFTGEDGSQDRMISDSHLTIGGRHFHIECQSTSDGNMVVRMFEYDVQIAMRHAEKKRARYTVKFPQSAVLYLRSTRNTPDYMEICIQVPGDSCLYQVPVIKAKEFSAEELFEKKLYFLIPFHIFRYEAHFAEYEKDEARLSELQQIFVGIREQLENLGKGKKLNEYDGQTILDMSKNVIQHIAANYARTSERIGEVMGGKILDYPAKEIRNMGRKEGRREGRREGRKEGIRIGEEKGRIQVYWNMLKLGFSQKDALAATGLTEQELSQAQTEEEDFSEEE